MKAAKIAAIIGLLGLLVSVPHAAQRWLRIGNGWFVDLNDRQRSGDIARIYVRGPTMDERYMVFDCKQRKNLTTDSGFSEGSIAGRVFRIACKNRLQIWQ